MGKVVLVAAEDFWASMREVAEAIRHQPAWMCAGITLNERNFVTFLPDTTTNRTTKGDSVNDTTTLLAKHKNIVRMSQLHDILRMLNERVVEHRDPMKALTSFASDLDNLANDLSLEYEELNSDSPGLKNE